MDKACLLLDVRDPGGSIMSRGTLGQWGPWIAVEKLGSGGNGTVWKVNDSDTGSEGALKVINTRNPAREPYRRFVQEIQTLENLNGFKGVLPLLDSYLPEDPATDGEPWFVMPVAQGIAQHLDSKGLHEVIAAMADIANTLARLAAEKEIAHRDLKPANLYFLDGQAVVGDFGLVADPERDGMTKDGKALGPRNFIPFEMLNAPSTANAFHADVYSFCKTLWVLACQTDVPPPGHQPANSKPHRIADYRPHTGADLLDRLIDRGTVINPDDRPTTESVSSELEAWLKLGAEPVELDLSGAALAVRGRLSSEIDESTRLEDLKDQGTAAAKRLEELMTPLNAALKQADPRAKISVMDDFVRKLIVGFPETGRRESVFEFSRASTLTTGSAVMPRVLKVGRGLKVFDNGDLSVRTLIDMGLDGVMQSDMFWQSDHYDATVGTATQEQVLKQAIGDLAEQMKTALRQLSEIAGG